MLFYEEPKKIKNTKPLTKAEKIALLRNKESYARYIIKLK